MGESWTICYFDEDKKIRRHRCAPGSSGYVGKKGTSIEASSNKYNPKSMESLW